MCCGRDKNGNLNPNLNIKELRPCVAKAFEIHTIKIAAYAWGGQIFDLSQIDVPTAEKLLKLGFPYIRRKQTANELTGIAEELQPQGGLDVPEETQTDLGTSNGDETGEQLVGTKSKKRN